MSRRKKNSDALAKARIRLTSIKSIAPLLDLGHGLGTAMYETAISETQTVLDAYNLALSQVDALANDFAKHEKSLEELNARILAAIGVAYGKDSNEYEMAGGTRSSEIRHPQRPKAVPTP